ncbi:MAG: type I-C CRISPR-associated protein Cas7/Csd2 [Treponema sp.]|uniref:type I-C CRISPR-associated protein Cas7/Csd2 n=1 Tax=Treponema sp. TaxID=166 RepID=UPI00298D64EF|nr:type I-C CRISPR-associated protein Cas7/Csd2 [Treponema sp.]MCQ2601724.1 type I-C CRISPR-associated protein Cas7/Csd2 [Treponema sp.]
MATLQNKIDFALVFTVKNANPNGDPLNGNIPRMTLDGRGELSDVCLKRKIRNRLQDFGEAIFVQSDDYRKDEHRSLRNRAEAVLGKAMKNEDELRKLAQETWIDVRSFGQVFAFKGGEGKGVSVGIRGPVTIQPAFSVESVNVTSLQITKSVSGEGDGTKRGSDTMGMKHSVDFGLYVTYGSINPQLAELTGFSDEDADKIKNAILHIFDNDASSARPEGSMEVVKLYWWKHNSKLGQYSAAKVHKTLEITKKENVVDAKSSDDYEIKTVDLDGLSPEVLSF